MTVQCPSCKAHLAISAAAACPRCHTELPRGTPQNLTTKSHTAPQATAIGIAPIAVTGAVVVALFLGYYMLAASPARHEQHQVSQALLTCQQAIRAQARYDGSDTPPYTRNYGSAGEFYFAWPTGSFYFTNQYGARETMSASCIGDLATGTIKQLTLNGQTIR
jgi:hypothetical protein